MLPHDAQDAPPPGHPPSPLLRRHHGPAICDGPRLRWLYATRERFGEEVWDIFAMWPAWLVDRFIEARFMRFEDSRFEVDEEYARKRGKTTIRFSPESERQFDLERLVPDPIIHARRTGNRRTFG